MWRKRKKLRKFAYLENEKSFFDGTKSIVHRFSFRRVSFDEKTKIADTSFKKYV